MLAMNNPGESFFGGDPPGASVLLGLGRRGVVSERAAQLAPISPMVLDSLGTRASQPGGIALG